MDTPRERLERVRAHIAGMETVLPHRWPDGFKPIEYATEGAEFETPTALDMSNILAIQKTGTWTRTEDGNSGSREHKCRTVGCIAGVTIGLYRNEVLKALSDPEKAAEADAVPVFSAVAKILGLEKKMAYALFCGVQSGCEGNLSTLSKERVLQAIDRAAAGRPACDLWNTDSN